MEKSVEKLLGQEGARAVEKNGPALESALNSGDGRAVRAALEGRRLEEALRRGDTEKVKGTVAELMATEEGRRLFSRLREILGK
ncbi:MAG: hypothetical protein II794_02865 [Oscillospiraceae bacterium]|nr:hypothetical protein [Oscillospiraceae bacterium]